MIRAVLDTNVIIGSFLSSNESSPNREVIDRLRAGEFRAQYSEDIIAEYIEVLTRKGVPDDEIDEFLRLFIRISEVVVILSFHLPHYPSDPDDIIFLLCAINGDSEYLVSNDSHLLVLEGVYENLSICETVRFLKVFRVA